MPKPLGFSTRSGSALPHEICANVIRAATPFQSSRRFSYALVNADTRTIVAEHNADQKRFIASLTKLMTLFVGLQTQRARRTPEDAPLMLTSDNWDVINAYPKATLQLAPNACIPFNQAAQAAFVLSANDAAASICSYIGMGSEKEGAVFMTEYARHLGMASTHFNNGSGLPASHEPEDRVPALNNISTARDMALLMLAINRDMPDAAIFRQVDAGGITNRSQQIRQMRIARDPDIRAFKTGYTDDAGHCLAVHAGPYILVALGCINADARSDFDRSIFAALKPQPALQPSFA